jgi:hypothetical protein
MTRPIGEMSSPELLALVGNRQLQEPDVLRVLRSPYCTLEIVERVLEQHRWMTSHKIRELVAGFRGLSATRALHLVATLPWLSMLQLAQSPRTPPLVRRAADRRMLDRMSQMALGERIAVARRAHRALLLPLIKSAVPEVLDALLDNPRLVENDILLMLNTVALPREVVTSIARHPRWGQYYRVRRALVECAAAPLPLALSAMVLIRRSDVRKLATRRDLPEAIRSAAKALIEKDQGRRRRMDPKRVVRFSDDERTGAVAETPEGVRPPAP